MTTSYSFFVIVKHEVVFVPIIEEIIEEDTRVHPVMSYVSIEINGIVQFQFNEKMNIPKGIQGLTFEETKEILSITMSPGLDQDPTKIGIIEYYFEKYTSN